MAGSQLRFACPMMSRPHFILEHAWLSFHGDGGMAAKQNVLRVLFYRSMCYRSMHPKATKLSTTTSWGPSCRCSSGMSCRFFDMLCTSSKEASLQETHLRRAPETLDELLEQIRFGHGKHVLDL